MTRNEELEKIVAAVKKGGYTKDEFNQFAADYGWQDWMNEYTESAEGEPITEENKNEEKEFCGGSPVAYWKVVNAKGEVERTFKHQVSADDFVTSTGCPYLYEVLPVWED